VSDTVKHHVTLCYTSSDDGIWLECTCKWQHHLGWDPTPATAWFQEQEHRRDVAEKAPPEDIHYP
jgi:hypothetical protein